MLRCAKAGALAAALFPLLAQAQEPIPGAGPFFLTVQIGGGIGTVAVGGGYRLARQQLEPEVLVGFVPRRLAGGPALGIITLKTTYIPFSPKLGQHLRVSPLTVGGMLNYTLGRRFFLTSQSTGRYPTKGYYWWSSAVRVGAFVGPRLTYVGAAAQGWRRTSAYAELSTNDLYLVSLLSNKTLSPAEILTLGLGAKISR
ncbi:hypothetical protein [Hymenobacter sp. BT730]|uniref:hypothetical protein n=1 Tax=Hymenobacter sp. BT730 TaxID=3063332 RepID=UPI0026DF3111|nr:hypothetical protein [Hymenobacter sp. BT730]